MSRLRECLQAAMARLQAAGSPSARADAEILLLHVLQKDRVWLRLHDDDLLSAADDAAFSALLVRRCAGEPVAYLVGSRGFWSFDVGVNPSTLIPRPETELLVEFALEKLPVGQAAPVLDLGTGSGVIALAVKKERPEARVRAVDASVAALAQAEANAHALGLAIEFRHSDWFSALAGERFFLVLGNPPYIDGNDAHLARGDLRFEPRTALVAAEAGMQDLRRIVEAAPEYLEAAGWLALEHGFEQAAAVRALMQARGYTAVASRRDLSGHERITVACWPGSALMSGSVEGDGARQ